MSDHSSSPLKGEKALFRDYLRSKAPDGISDIYTHYLTEFECFRLNAVAHDLVHGILDGDPEPIPEIDFLITELSGLIHNLQQLKEGFERFKQKEAI